MSNVGGHLLQPLVEYNTASKVESAREMNRSLKSSVVQRCFLSALKWRSPTSKQKIRGRRPLYYNIRWYGILLYDMLKYTTLYRI